MTNIQRADLRSLAVGGYQRKRGRGKDGKGDCQEYNGGLPFHGVHYRENVSVCQRKVLILTLSPFFLIPT